MSALRIAFVLILLLALSAPGAAVRLWNGKGSEDVEIVSVRDGIMTFRLNGTEARVKLLDVKDMDLAAKETEPYCRLVGFKDSKDEKQPGRLLGLCLNDPRPRINEPLVRVFALQESAEGERRLRLYRNNRRADDPTRTCDLPEVQAAAYRERWFLASGDAAVAWRVEVWVDGQLRLEHEEKPEELSEDWWRAQKLSRSSTLRDADKPGTAPARRPGREIPPVSCTIQSCRLAPDITPDGERVRVSVRYDLTSTEVDEAPLPDVTLHYVSEDAEGKKTVRSLDCEPDSGDVTKLGGGTLVRSFESALPKGVKVGVSSRIRSSRKRIDNLVYWRLQVDYRDEVIAVMEKAPKSSVPNDRVRDSLPDQWWR